MANMIALLFETVSRPGTVSKVFHVNCCGGSCLFFQPNEMGGLTGWHVTTMRRWHGLL